ncbi:3-hydroxyacyl-CoA dehydrogenase NAD-binding domain-containing protein [Natrinema halophilum]|uniref:3-hydroxyacyl-CoA dehydrogenase NAD-binding domain-containing protein n=1 Tax=Natrinema halophilum TaxID=1699371 RepID=UPI0024DF1D32|nr:3-hydroxyacyl-CoA dehydrogenase NAD-binding domain-containing protein [Natrinema halophilum]
MTQQSATVVGGGIMGTGIAQVLARNGYDVSVRELNDELVGEARERLISGNYGLDDAVEGGYLSEDERDEVVDRVTFTTDLADATNGTDFVIEAVTEDLAVKGQVFRNLNDVTDDQPLYSNTSGYFGSLDCERRLRSLESCRHSLLQPGSSHVHGRDCTGTGDE